MRRRTSMTSVLALSAAMLSSTHAGAQEAPASNEAILRIAPHYGNLDPFYGNIDPFYGTIDPFWGDINPFWGNINPFFGDIDAFWGDLAPFGGGATPFWGDISPFWGDIGPFWGDINSFWGNIDPFAMDAADDYSVVITDLQELVTRSQTLWGSAVYASTSKSFADGFANSVFAKYGIDLNDASSLAGLDAKDRSLFFLDWYDGLMAFSGADHVDHWMPTINWSPSITQDQGNGYTTVGLLDVKISNNGTAGRQVNFVGGYNYSVNDHGYAVSGLIAGKHDGKGVMGIAPKAKLINYNPFDTTGTASWGDVTTGINALRSAGANVINMSLGIPGWSLNEGWNTVYSNLPTSALNDTVLVKAAGNEGVTQSQNIAWTSGKPENLIIVGSTNPAGTISWFSNTPGEACLTTGTTCTEQDKIKYRFLVAPGELILVADIDGALSRVSGTSFAAPLVAGAVALLHDRWPWLDNHAGSTTDIIFQSARDLGAPGVDGVYGWGMLDVEAAQSPLNFDNLEFWLPEEFEEDAVERSGHMDRWSTQKVKDALLAPGGLMNFENGFAFIHAFEDIGSTYRDFTIPLSSRVENQSFEVKDKRYEDFQRHTYQRLVDWANGTGFTDMDTYFVPLTVPGGVTFDFAATPLNHEERMSGLETTPFYSEVGITHGASGLEVRLGTGAGATRLTHQSGFGLRSDYDLETGGVNPFPGFASGNEYVSASWLTPGGTSLMAGFTSRDDDHIVQEQTTGRQFETRSGFDAYKASAMTFGVTHGFSDTLVFSASYARLDEKTGLLGSQGTGALSLNGGTLTDALTMGLSILPSPDFTLSLSATAGNTRKTNFAGSLLGIGQDGIQSSAFAIAARKQGIFAKTDALRLSFMQPLHIEKGSITYRSMQVTDRQTGTLDVVTRHWDLGDTSRNLVAEVLYASPLSYSAARVSLYGQATFNSTETTNEEAGWAFGINFRSHF